MVKALLTGVLFLTNSLPFNDSSDDMANVIETNDPQGRLVVCKEDQWTNHILVGHPEMQGKEELVKQTIEKPYLHASDKVRKNREVYYQHPTKLKARYLKVVVDYTNSEGEIVTAFQTDGMKSGEKLIYD